MPVTCTWRDLGRLRNQPGRPGPIAKLLSNESQSQSTVIDKFRVLRFTRALGSEVDEYTKMLFEIGKKYGTPKEIGGGFTSFEVPSEKRQAFDAEQATLDAAEHVVDVSPLPVSAYEHANLTPADLALLEKFLVVPDEI
jgi:hypothetical protein